MMQALCVMEEGLQRTLEERQQPTRPSIRFPVFGGSGLFRMLGEGDGYLKHLSELAVTGKISGAMIHNARVAAICYFHGVSELWSADRDFNRFPTLKVRNPLLDLNLA